MGFNTGTWGSISAGQSLTTGIIWSPFNGNGTGGADMGAQINLAGPEDVGCTLISTDQTKEVNPDASVAYFVTVTCTQSAIPSTDFILQGGGF